MQFLAYIVVLMVSASTILLELHWLTSPATQPKSVVQAASAPAPRPKAEGPNIELSPVYPKPEAPRSIEGVTGASAASATAATEPAAKAEPATQPAAAETIAKFEPLSPPLRKPAAETTGAAPPESATQPTASSATFTSTVTNAPAAPAANVASKNQCDVAGCSGAYKSFRASDCTYQPTEGARRLCTRSELGQKTASEPRGPNADAGRKLSKDAELRDVERAVRRITDRNTAVAEPGIDDEPSQVIVIRRPRW